MALTSQSLSKYTRLSAACCVVIFISEKKTYEIHIASERTKNTSTHNQCSLCAQNKYEMNVRMLFNHTSFFSAHAQLFAELCRTRHTTQDNSEIEFILHTHRESFK